MMSERSKIVKRFSTVRCILSMRCPASVSFSIPTATDLKANDKRVVAARPDVADGLAQSVTTPLLMLFCRGRSDVSAAIASRRSAVESAM
jgi:hypothetical protein